MRVDQLGECPAVTALRLPYEAIVRIHDGRSNGRTNHPMKILLWHGYPPGRHRLECLHALAGACVVTAGPRVVVFCQDPHPERYDVGSARVVRPDIGRILPVFVVDRYEDVEAHRVQDLGWEERERFVAANATALREHLPADLLFTNHLILGGPVGAAAGVPYVVKAHGSELEFSLRGNDELCRWARETLEPAKAVVAGTDHVRRVIAEVLGPGPWLDRTHLVPPGVDVEEFRPRPREEALAGLLAEARLDPPNPPEHHNQRLPDEGNAERLERFLSGDGPTVVFVGRVSREKGAHVLVDALRSVRARCVMVGWGTSARSSSRRRAISPCSSPAPWSIATSFISTPSQTSRSRRPPSRRRSASSPPRRLPAARPSAGRAPLGPRRGRRGARGRVPSGAAVPDELRERGRP